MGILDNKVSIITGAASGIGRAAAIKIANEGSKVIVSDLNEDGGRKTVEMVEKKGGSALFVKADASSAKDNEMLVNEAVKHFGGLHLAVNNAGVGGPSAPTGEYPIEGWDKVISINLSGVFYGMRYQIPAMIKSGGGSIVNIASILGQVGFANAPAYVAAKHGVVGLTKNAALEYSSQKIRVNSVGPGFINTPMIENNLTLEMRTGLVSMHPIGRLGEPDEVAEMIVWLGSDKASFVTGAYFAVDGGYLTK